MASPQVEIVPSQNFGCVLRDRNRRHDNLLEKNLKALVKDHRHHRLNHHQHQQQQTLIRISSESAVSDENSQNRIDSWIKNQQKQNRNSRVQSPEFLRPKKECNFSDSSKETKRVPAETHKHSPEESAIPRSERSEKSKRNENLGASSLVQIWEARLNRSNGGTPPSQDQSTANSSRSSSGVSIQETLCSGPSIDGESEPDGESKNPDRTVEIESESCVSVSDSGDSKSGRVSDIIKRLSSEQKQLPGEIGLLTIRTPRPCLSPRSLSVPEKCVFPAVTCSPRIRGRQAFADLLMQLERDRHRELDSLLERNAVSKFPQRGRLQSMLRLRSLQRCLAIQDRHRSNVKTAELNRQETGFAVLHLRERFRTNAAAAAAAPGANGASKEVHSKIVVAERSRQLKESRNLPRTSVTERLSPLNHMVEEANLCKNEDIVDAAAESKMTCLQPQETRGTEVSNSKSENAIPSAGSTSLRSPETGLWDNKEENIVTDALPETPETLSGLLESGQEVQYLERQETSSLNDWEEYEDEQSCYRDTNHDWFSEISRPRSHWEDLRKNRYMEVMNKEDIRRLLERRTVSSFLESGLRENIDRIIMSRVQRQPVQRVEERTSKWEITQEFNQEEEEVEREEEQEQIEAEEQDSDGSSHSFSQMFSPSPGGSWSFQDTGVTSTPLLPIHNHPSPEMELINAMRAQIQQLQQEMSELRDSVKTCMDANTHLQQSVHRENPLKRKCCVCNETQIESLLYRCGHMCTCLKCANELQWNGGKCPICRAQILDVVRVFVDPRS